MNNSESSSPNEENIINRIADWVFRQEMATPALLLLHTVKPLAYVGGELGRFVIAPYSIFVEKDLDKTDKYIDIFQNQDNIDKLIKIIDEQNKEKEKKKEEEKKKRIEKYGYTGWRKYLHSFYKKIKEKIRREP